MLYTFGYRAQLPQQEIIMLDHIVGAPKQRLIDILNDYNYTQYYRLLCLNEMLRRHNRKEKPAIG